MMKPILSLSQRNAILLSMAALVSKETDTILTTNQSDCQRYEGTDLALRERLEITPKMIATMVESLYELAKQEDPLGKDLYHFVAENGLQVSNKTAPFGTILIIYESRPDVTIEAAGIAFKSGNQILLKGGKEALQTNLLLVNLWHQALLENKADKDWISYLAFDRNQTQAFLEKPTQKIDLVVPRGGESLIAFVKKYSTCPVIVSGRGNNFAYVHSEADVAMALKIILNAKTSKISACNALDKVLLDTRIPNFEIFVATLIKQLKSFDVEILVDDSLESFENTTLVLDESVWYEEFLASKIVLGTVATEAEAFAKINHYCGGHSATIITKDTETAQNFMDAVDVAAVYHNASTRFTDGGQLGLGGELAISTDKLHHRGPIGLQHLVTNKWYINGNGQIR